MNERRDREDSYSYTMLVEIKLSLRLFARQFSALVVRAWRGEKNAHPAYLLYKSTYLTLYYIRMSQLIELTAEIANTSEYIT